MMVIMESPLDPSSSGRIHCTILFERVASLRWGTVTLMECLIEKRASSSMSMSELSHSFRLDMRGIPPQTVAFTAPWFPTGFQEVPGYLGVLTDRLEFLYGQTKPYVARSKEGEGHLFPLTPEAFVMEVLEHLVPLDLNLMNDLHGHPLGRCLALWRLGAQGIKMSGV